MRKHVPREKYEVNEIISVIANTNGHEACAGFVPIHDLFNLRKGDRDGLCPNTLGNAQYDRDKEGYENKFIYCSVEQSCNKGTCKSA